MEQLYVRVPYESARPPTPREEKPEAGKRVIVLDISPKQDNVYDL